MKLEAKIESLEKVDVRKEKNCLGTALYLAGVIDEDILIDMDDAYVLLNEYNRNRFKKTDKFDGEEGLVAWECNLDGVPKIVHLGYARKNKSSGEIEVVNRRDGEVFIEPLNGQLTKLYSQKNVALKFYWAY